MDATDLILLYDYYGDLLTDRQKECFELRYNQDLSLGEIGNELGISRQGVFDNLNRKFCAIIVPYARRQPMRRSIKLMISTRRSVSIRAFLLPLIIIIVNKFQNVWNLCGEYVIIVKIYSKAMKGIP